MDIKLVPIRVGMIPVGLWKLELNTTCPHTRGDDPKNIIDYFAEIDLSPYAWG